MMEHLKGRPVALVRAPSGIAGELFFQKGIVQFDRALDPGHPPLLEVAYAAGLLSAAQMNVIEFHTWNAVERTITKPDRMTFDLDPGEGVTWRQVQEAAQLLHAFLDELKLAAFLKTSGGKGLHVVVPLKPPGHWHRNAQVRARPSRPSRVAHGNSPWGDYDASRNSLAGAMKALGFGPG